jgi:hypothetical protein
MKYVAIFLQMLSSASEDAPTQKNEKHSNGIRKNIDMMK